MKIATVIAIVLLAVAAVPFATGESVSTKPAGVSSSAWIPINDSLGFVVTSEHADSARAVEGYFVIQKRGVWKRIEAVSAARLHPG